MKGRLTQHQECWQSDNRGSSRTPCRKLFEEIDTDSSGGIDAEELAAGLLKRGYSLTRDEVDQLIDRMDLNQDGHIAFDEFSSALVDWKKVQRSFYLVQIMSLRAFKEYRQRIVQRVE